MKAFMGVGSEKASETSSSESSDDVDYRDANEDDINSLAKLLGGGF